MRRLLLGLVLAGCVAGCSKEAPRVEQDLTLVLPPKVGPKASQLLEQTWPRVNQVCPGLRKYSRSLQVVDVEDNLDRDYGTPKVTVTVKVPDEPCDIPNDYHATGHNCYLDIAPDGNSVTLSKRACIAVALDKPFNPNGGQVTMSLW